MGRTGREKPSQFLVFKHLLEDDPAEVEDYFRKNYFFYSFPALTIFAGNRAAGLRQGP